MLILGNNTNLLEYHRSHKLEKYIYDKKNIKSNFRDLIKKSSDLKIMQKTTCQIVFFKISFL